VALRKKPHINPTNLTHSMPNYAPQGLVGGDLASGLSSATGLGEKRNSCQILRWSALSTISFRASYMLRPTVDSKSTKSNMRPTYFSRRANLDPFLPSRSSPIEAINFLSLL